MLLLIAFERWQEKGVIVSRNTCYSYRYSRPFHFSWPRINLSEKKICFHLRSRCPPNGSFKTPCQLKRIAGNQHPHKDLPLRGLEIFFFPQDYVISIFGLSVSARQRRLPGAVRLQFAPTARRQRDRGSACRCPTATSGACGSGREPPTARR